MKTVNSLVAMIGAVLCAMTLGSAYGEVWGEAWGSGGFKHNLTNQIDATGGVCLDTADLAAGVDEIRFVKNEIMVDHIDIDGLNLKFVGAASGTTLKPDPKTYCQFGGAIYATGCKLVITNLTFVDFYAESAGGAICIGSASGDSVIADCHFKNCRSSMSAGAGGAVYASAASGCSATLAITNCSFVACQAANGGAITTERIYPYKEKAMALAVSKCEFVDNDASYSGGAIWNEGNIELAATSFDGCQAGVNGGAICAGSTDVDFAGLSFKLLPKVTFDGNAVTDQFSTGGAIALMSAGIDFMGECAAFRDNSADFLGGALFASSGSVVRVSTSIFSSNTVSEIVAMGGALSVEGSSCALTNLTIRGSNGGAIDFYLTDAEVVNCVVVDNKDGDISATTLSGCAPALTMQSTAYGSLHKGTGVVLNEVGCLDSRTEDIYDGDTLYLKGDVYNPVAAEGLVQDATDFDGVKYGSRLYGYSMGAYECSTASGSSSDSFSGVYDGNGHTITVAVATSVVSSKWLYSTESQMGPWVDYNPAFTNVGTYWVWACPSSSVFSTSMVISNTVTISRRPVTIWSESNTNLTYTGVAQTYPTLSVENATAEEIAAGTKRTGFVPGEGVASTSDWTEVTKVSDGIKTNAFTYVLKLNDAYGSVVDNYSVTVKNGLVAVSPRTADWREFAFEMPVTNYVYEAKGHEPKPVVSNTVTQVKIPADDYCYTYINNTNACTLASSNAAVVVTFKPNADFQGSVTNYFEIAQRPVTLQAESAKRQYDSTELTTNAIFEVVINDGTIRNFVAGEGVVLTAQMTSASTITEVGISNNVINAAAPGLVPTGDTLLANYIFSYTNGTLEVFTAVPSPIDDPTVDDKNGPFYDDPAKPQGSADMPTPPIPESSPVSMYDVTKVYAGIGYTVDTNAIWTAAKTNAVYGNKLDCILYSLTGKKDSWTVEVPVFTNVTVTSFWYKVKGIDQSFSNYIHAAGVTITQRVVQVTSGDQTWTYDGLDHQNTNVWVSAGSFAPGEGVSTNDFATINNVGTSNNSFVVIWDNANITNYDFSVVTGKISVTRKSPTDGGLKLKAVSDTFYYNADEKKPRPGVTDMIGGVETTLVEGDDFEYSWLNNTNATETAKVIATFKGNYTGALTNDFTIKSRSVTLDAHDKSWTYDGDSHAWSNVTATVYDADGGYGFVPGEGVVTSEFATVRTVTNDVVNTFVWKYLNNTLATNYVVTVTNGMLAIVTAPMPSIDPDDPTNPTNNPAAGPFGPELPIDQPLPPAETNNVHIQLSSYDMTWMYDGSAHTIDTNSLIRQIENSELYDNPYEISYSLDGKNWYSDPFFFTDAGATSFWYRVEVPNFTNYIHAAGLTITKAPLTIEINDFVVNQGQDFATNGLTYVGFVASDTNTTALAGEIDYTFVNEDPASGDVKTNRLSDVEKKTYRKGFYTISNEGEFDCRNYEVTYIPGRLEVKGEYTVTYQPGCALYDGTMADDKFLVEINYRLQPNQYVRRKDADGRQWNFIGWSTNGASTAVFGDEQEVINLTEPEGRIDLTAVWTHNYVIFGDITGDFTNVVVRMVPVGAQLAYTGDVYRVGSSWSYTAQVPVAGEYNLVADFWYSTETNVTTVTILKDIVDPRTRIDIAAPSGDWNSRVDNTAAGQWPVIASRLDEIAINSATGFAKRVEVDLIVTDKPNYSDMTTAEQTNYWIIVDASHAVTNDVAHTCNVERVVHTFDLTVVKRTTYTNEAGYVTQCVTNYPGRNGDEDITQPIRMLIQFDVEGRTDFWVYRCHEGTPVPLDYRPEIVTNMVATNDNCWAILNEEGKHYFIIQSSKFSLYGIGYRGTKLCPQTTAGVVDSIPIEWTQFKSLADGRFYGTLKLECFDGWQTQINNLELYFPTISNDEKVVFAQLLQKTANNRYVAAPYDRVKLANLFAQTNACGGKCTWGLADGRQTDATTLTADQLPLFALYIRDGKLPEEFTNATLIAEISYDSYGWTNRLAYTLNKGRAPAQTDSGANSQQENTQQEDTGITAGDDASTTESKDDVVVVGNEFQPIARDVTVASDATAPWLSAAQTYDGYLYTDDDAIAGVIQLKVTKAKTKQGVTSSTVSATVQLKGATKKLSFKKGVADATGAITAMTSSGWSLSPTLGVQGLGGKMTSGATVYKLDGVRNRFADKSEKATAETALKNAQPGVVAAWADANVGGKAPGTGWHTLSAALAAKGKAKLSYVLADGSKLAATGQLLVGDDFSLIPAVVTKKVSGSLMSLAVLIRFDTKGVTVMGLGDEVRAAKIDSAWVSTGVEPYWEEADVPAAIGSEYYFILSDAAWKPKYTAKTGLLKASYKVLTNAEKPKKTSVTFTGVVIDGVGYGTSVISRKGSWKTTVR